MCAILNGQVVNERSDIKVDPGYEYFSAFSTRLDLLQGAPKTDLACPHDVQFCVVIVDDVRNERAAWSQEAPRLSLPHIGGRFGFWQEVEVS
jgi:uncharacterized protein (DUF427 family)